MVDHRARLTFSAKLDSLHLVALHAGNLEAGGARVKELEVTGHAVFATFSAVLFQPEVPFLAVLAAPITLPICTSGRVIR